MIKSQLIIFTSKYAYPPGTLVICVLKEGHLSQFPFFASHIQWMAESWSFCLFNISLSSPLLHSWHFSGHHHPRIWWLRPKHDFTLSSSDLNLVHLCIVHLYMGNSGEAIPIPRFMKEEMATHSRILDWKKKKKIPWTEEPEQLNTAYYDSYQKMKCYVIRSVVSDSLQSCGL